MTAPNDSYVRIATDGTGKYMETALERSAALDATGAAIDVQRQRAEILGSVEENIDQLVKLDMQILGVLRQIATVLLNSSNVTAFEDDSIDT